MIERPGSGGRAWRVRGDALGVRDSVVAAVASDRIVLLQNRPMIDGKPTAYICENFTCKAPCLGVAPLEGELK